MNRAKNRGSVRQSSSGRKVVPVNSARQSSSGREPVPVNSTERGQENPFEAEEALIRTTREASPYSHLDEEASPLEVIRHALTAGAMVRRGDPGAFEAIAAQVTLVRYATDQLAALIRMQDPEGHDEMQELVEITRSNLSTIEGHARSAAQWFRVGGS